MTGFRAGDLITDTDLGQRLMARDAIGNTEVVHKFGGYDAVGTVDTPICGLGIYRTPQVAGATALRVKAGNAADTAAGVGAREITLEGLDATGAFQITTLATAGASASANTSVNFLRLVRAYVSASGVYADPNITAVPSQAATIVIENAAGTEDWANLILDAAVGHCQTQIACYTVPLGKRAFVQSLTFQVDTTRSADVVFQFRENILQTAAPYSAARTIMHIDELQDRWELTHKFPLFLQPLTDILFLGSVVSGTGDINIAYDIILEDDQ